MRIEQWKPLLESAKLIADIATPVIAGIVGLCLLRWIEGTKSDITQGSDFRKKWAEQFFDCCQQFSRATERYVALINQVASVGDRKSDALADWLKELNSLHPTLSELEIRVRRNVVFAPEMGPYVTVAAQQCLGLLTAMVESGTGSNDALIDRLDYFNKASREAHAEMLGLKTSLPQEVESRFRQEAKNPVG